MKNKNAFLYYQYRIYKHLCTGTNKLVSRGRKLHSDFSQAYNQAKQKLTGLPPAEYNIVIMNP